MLFVLTPAPKPSALNEESGFTWRTPLAVSALNTCGVTL